MPIDIGGFQITAGMESNLLGLPPIYDDLALYLNASQYAGSGNTWIDSAQNITFTSAGTQTPYTTVNSRPCFDFNGSGYWYSSAADAQLVEMRYSFTLILLYYHQGIGERDTIFEKAGTSYQSYEQELAMTAETAGSISYYRGRSTYDAGYTKTNTTNAWNFTAIKSEGTTTRTGHYWRQSDTSWVSGYTSRSSTAILQAGSIRLGTGYAGAMESGYIGGVLVYTRALSTSEMNTLYTYFSTLYTGLVG